MVNCDWVSSLVSSSSTPMIGSSLHLLHLLRLIPLPTLRMSCSHLILTLHHTGVHVTCTYSLCYDQTYNVVHSASTPHWSSFDACLYVSKYIGLLHDIRGELKIVNEIRKWLEEGGK